MILAWSWTPTVFLAGAVLAAGPVLIHLLNRRRFRILDWAAMRLLLESRRRNRRRLRLEELLLLALRVVACLGAGLALANVRGGPVLAGPDAHAAHVFILDDSLSMGQRVGGETLFAKAARGVSDFVASLPPADLVGFVSATQPEAGGVHGRLHYARDLRGEDPAAGDASAGDASTGNPATGGASAGRASAGRPSAGALASMRPNDLPARLGDALAAAGRLLAPQADAVRRVYLVSDFRRTDFAGPAADVLRRAFAALADAGCELVLLDYGVPAAGNLAVEKVELLDKAAVAGVKARLRAVVRNHGPEAVQAVPLTVQVGEVVLPALALDRLAPGESVAKEFTYTFATPGSAAVRAGVTPDALPADDSAALAVDVREALRVLVVDGSPDAARPASGAAFCLARAIDPTGTGGFGQRADVVPAEGLADVRFDDYDAVFLAGVGEFPAARDEAGRIAYPSLAALQRYVRDGGGLAIFLGDRVRLDFYNGPLWAGGAGLSPLRLGAPVPATPDPGRFVRLRPDSIAPDPMLRAFTGRGEAFTRLVRFYVYMPAEEMPPADEPPTAGPAALPAGSPTAAGPTPQPEPVRADDPPAAGPAEVLARFDDAGGPPAVVRRTVGRGTVLVWYSSAETRWTDWPKDLTFLPVVNDMLASLVRADASGRAGPVGRPLRFALPPDLADAAVTVATPAYPQEDVSALAPRVDGTEKMVEFAAARWAGIYELKFVLPDRSERAVLFSRHVEPAEGDLARADRADLERAVGRDHVYQGGLALEPAAIGRRADDKAYAGPLLVVVLAVLAVETVLARRFGHYTAAAPRRRA